MFDVSHPLEIWRLKTFLFSHPDVPNRDFSLSSPPEVNGALIVHLYKCKLCIVSCKGFLTILVGPILAEGILAELSFMMDIRQPLIHWWGQKSQTLLTLSFFQLQTSSNQ